MFGRHFDLEELPSGELILRPVRVVRDAAAAASPRVGRAPAFRIADVEQVVFPTREQCNARGP